MAKIKQSDFLTACDPHLARFGADLRKLCERIADTEDDCVHVLTGQASGSEGVVTYGFFYVADERVALSEPNEALATIRIYEAAKRFVDEAHP